MRSKTIAAGAGLLAYGIAVGWAITADHYDAKMRRNNLLFADRLERRTMELEAAKALLMERPMVETPAATEEELIEDESETYTEVSSQDEFRGETVEETRENLREIIAPYVPTNSEDEEAFIKFSENLMEGEAMNNIPPFVISKELFDHDPDEGDDYEKITLEYFPRDRIVTEDHDAWDGDEVDKLLGWQNLGQFGGESRDPDVVYIRNRTLQVDYEVVQDTAAQAPAHLRYGLTRAQHEASRTAGVGTVRFRHEDV